MAIIQDNGRGRYSFILPSNAVVEIKRKREDTKVRLEEGISCEICFNDDKIGSYGKTREFFMKATAEILGVPDPFSIPEAHLGSSHLAKVFAEKILEKYGTCKRFA